MKTSDTVAVGTLNADQVQQVLATAEKAPAVHHLRPWRFACTTTTIELLLDPPAGAQSEDEDHREAWVACGAALLNLRLAIRACGIEPVVHLLPDRDRPALLAAVEIDGHRANTTGGLELSMAIALLDTGTDTQHFEREMLPDALIGQLRYAARIEQAWIAPFPASALPPQDQPVDQIGQRPRPANHDQILVLGTLQDDPTSRLRAGQAMQRVLLTTTKFDLSVCFIAMSPNLTASREQLRHLIGGALWPQVLLQLGHIAA
jgi:hypothetical protein